MNVCTLMRQAVHFNADRPAIATQDRTLTFSEAWDRGVRLANGLRALGVQPGDRVGGVDDNTLGAADLFIACAIAGAVRVPLYPRNSREAHAYMLGHTQCRVVVVETSYVPDVAGLEEELADLAHVLVRDEGYETWLSEQDPTDPKLPIDDRDWYAIRHSGGTTGKPKGVAYTHQDWLLCCRNWFEGLPRLSQACAIGHAGPISHASGYFFLPGWLFGGVNVLFGAFDPDTALDMIERHRVTHMVAVPSILQALTRAQNAKPRGVDSIEALLVGGAPITDATLLAGRETFGRKLYSIFGQTEALPVALMGPDEWFGEMPGSTPMRSVGRVRPYVELEIRDDAGNALPIGEDGEIVVRVEGQMHGYWGNEELTQDTIVDGWVHMGDIGRLDANGYLYVLDRLDDKIISGAYNIWPAELETVIADHPAVIEVAVFGIPDERWGETPMALCCVDGTTPVSEEEIIDLCRMRLGSYKRPSRVELTSEPLPKSVVGKLQRKKLREPYWQDHSSRVAGV
ncbi:MAG: o-succinylbenzoate--CoA ligase [Solirubrobacterales bacterium]|nr:o-succinylbenzoate--CoA ligase [Solirubrobacterales bacterium]